MKTIKIRFTAVFATVLLITALLPALPQTAMQVYADDAPSALVLGSGVLAKDVGWEGWQTVAYGGTDWGVLGYDGDGNSLVAEDDLVTLLQLNVFDRDVQFNYDKSQWDSYAYYKSTLKSYLESLEYEGDNAIFSSAEQDAISTRTLKGGGGDLDGNLMAGDDVDARLWPLSVFEAEELSEDMLVCNAVEGWWLRTPGYQYDHASYVRLDWGHFVSADGCNVDFNLRARPAMDLYMSAILLTSSAEGGKVSGETGKDALSPVGTNASGQWKLTIKNAAHNDFTVTNEEQDNLLIRAEYKGAVYGEKEYISAILVNEDGVVTHYGRLLQVADEDHSAGSVEVNLAGKYQKGDKLYLLNETVNDDRQTDYASELAEVTVSQKEILSVGITASQVQCGTEVITPSEPFPLGPGEMWLWAQQDPKPQVTLAANAPYHFADRDDSCVWIYIDPLTDKVEGMNGTLLGSRSWPIDMYLAADLPFYFGENTAVTVTGGELALQEITDDGLLHLRVNVTPVHNIYEVPAVPATCTEDGNLTYYTCDGCGFWFEDSEGAQFIEKHSTKIIPALGHDWGDWKVTKKPTLDAEGEKQRVCQRCELVQKKSIDKLININNAKVVLTAASFTYNGKVQKPTIKTIGGKALTAGTDYTASWSDTSSKNAGTYTVTIKGKGNYAGTTTATYKIKAKAITPTVELSKKVYTWNGKAKKPAVTVKDGTAILDPSDYTVTYADGRKNVGTYKVTVKLKGNYSGKKVVSFRINPKGTTLVSLTPGTKKMTVKWNKQAAQVTGYQIQYSRSSTFATGNKTVKVTSRKTTSKTIKELKTGKKYYVRIRTYKTVNGKTYYSGWSKKKSVTVK